MSIFQAADAYDRFIGRYSPALARKLAAVAGVGAGDAVLDVGCGTGLGTAALTQVVPSGRVVAVDPSEAFVAAAKRRLPEVEIRVAGAEDLPFEDDTFDASLAQLVFAFVESPERSAREMRRVTRPGRPAAACMWDVGGDMTLLRAFWEAAREVVPERSEQSEERRLRFVREGELADLWAATGFEEVRSGTLSVEAAYEGIDDLWTPIAAGVGPSGAFAASLEPEAQAALKDALRRRLAVGDGPFGLSAGAWYAVGTA